MPGTPIAGRLSAVRLARLVRFPPVVKAMALGTAGVLGLGACGTVAASSDSLPSGPQVRVTASQAPPTSTVMDERRFWSIIASTRSSRSTSQRAEILQGKLRKLPPRQIAEFDRHLIRAINSISEPKHLGAAEVVMGSTSKNAFVHLRAWIAAQGEYAHARFLGDPDSLVDVGLDREGELVAGEMVLVAPARAYRAVTGRLLNDDYPDLPPPTDLASSQDGPSYAQLARDLPRLAATYLPSPVPAGNAFADGPRAIVRR